MPVKMNKPDLANTPHEEVESGLVEGAFESVVVKDQGAGPEDAPTAVQHSDAATLSETSEPLDSVEVGLTITLPTNMPYSSQGFRVTLRRHVRAGEAHADVFDQTRAWVESRLQSLIDENWNAPEDD